jgi:hypothetical protein
MEIKDIHQSNSRNGQQEPRRERYPTITRIGGPNWGKFLSRSLLVLAVPLAAAGIVKLVNDAEVREVAQEHLANSPTVEVYTQSDWYMIQDGKASAFTGEGDHGGYKVSKGQYERQFSEDNPNLRILDGWQYALVRDTNGDGKVTWERSE